jgi:hypothetical protein
MWSPGSKPDMGRVLCSIGGGIVPFGAFQEGAPIGEEKFVPGVEESGFGDFESAVPTPSNDGFGNFEGASSIEEKEEPTQAEKDNTGVEDRGDNRDDLNLLRANLQGQGKDGNEIKKLMKDARYKRNKVRRRIRAAEEIRRMLREVTKAYQDKKVFRLSYYALQKKILDEVDKGRISDDHAGTLYYNLGTNDNPDYRTTRGTSQLEIFHKLVRVVLRHVVDAETGYSILCEFLWRWNKGKEFAFYGDKVNKYATNPDTLNRLCLAYRELGIENHPFTGWNIFEVDPDDTR